MNIENFKQLAESCGLSIIFRLDHLRGWENTLAQCSYVPVIYTNNSIEFQFANQKSHGGRWQDLSVLVYFDNSPIAVWPISLAYIDDRIILNSHGLSLLPPLFIKNCTSATIKNIIKKSLTFLEAIAKLTKINFWEGSQPYIHNPNLSNWHVESMSREASCVVYHEAFVNLRLPISEIKSNFRKSYKSLINSGMRLWKVDVLDVADEIIWNEFHNLHFKVAGRHTRSDETWLLHLQDIEAHRGFLVYLRDAAGKMVGGGFFNFTCDEGLYSVAAYDRTLFHKPLGHVVQYRAIEELKKREVRWYKLGRLFYSTDIPEPTKKEISISEFKAGFATDIFPHFMFHNQVKHAEQITNGQVFSVAE